MLDQCSAPIGLQSLAAVDRAGANADRTAVPVTGNLNETVKQLLNRSRAPLCPRLPGVSPKVLRGLHDSQLRIRVKIWKHLRGHIRPGGKVGVEDQDEVPIRLAEGMAQVPGLLIPATVRSHQIGKAETGRHHRHFLASAVIKHIRSDRAWVVLSKLSNMRPGVPQDL